MIQFAYTNGKLITLLQQRGQKLANADFKGASKVEAKINELKEKEFESLTVPSIAFVTFEEQEGYDQACKYLCKERKVQFLGSRIKVKPAPEPTNIIWENKGITKKMRRVRMVFITLACIVLLAVAAFLIAYMKGIQLQVVRKYPDVDCGLVDEQYKKMLKKFAYYEYVLNYVTY